MTNNAKVTLSVSAQSLRPLSYQWLFNNSPVPGAAGQSYVIPGVQPTNVGVYSVRVSNATRSVRSGLAVVEIGLQPQAISEDKLQDITAAGVGPAPADSRRRANFASVAGGTLGTHILDNFGASKEQNEPNPAGVVGGASRWFQLQMETNGTLIVDTIGSDIDTVMGIYTGTDYLNLTLEASDDNGAPDGVRSKVTLPVSRGNYLVVVDGVKGATGNIKLNWKLGSVPAITSQPAGRMVRAGENVTLSVGATGVPAPNYQWRFNGVNIFGATNATLTINNAQSANAGKYMVTVNNLMGSAPSATAELAVIATEPPRLSEGKKLANGTFRFRLTSATDPSYEIQASTDLLIWLPISTNQPSNSEFDFVDPTATIYPWRFYRAVPHR